MRRLGIVVGLCLSLVAHADEGRAGKLLRRGQALLDEGKPADAEVLFREAVKLAPGKPGPHFFLGKALAVQGRCDEGVGELQQYLRMTTKGQDMDEAARLVHGCQPPPPPASPAPAIAAAAAPAPAPAAAVQAEAAPAHPGETIYGAGGGFATSGAYGLELGLSYAWTEEWEARGSYLLGFSSTKTTMGTKDITLHVARLRVARRFPRGRIVPFIGASLLIDHVTIEGNAATTGGIAAEPGILFQVTGWLNVFAELPIGFVIGTQVCHSAGCTNVDPLFGGFAAGIEVGGGI